MTAIPSEVPRISHFPLGNGNNSIIIVMLICFAWLPMKPRIMYEQQARLVYIHVGHAVHEVDQLTQIPVLCQVLY